MSGRFVIAALLLSTVIAGCTKEYDCADLQLQPAFVNYLPADINTFTLRKFKANDNYRTLIDTFVVNYGYNALYQTYRDTTSVLITAGYSGIMPGFDWQLFIPAKNKTVLIADIVSEKKTGERGYGIFSLDPAPGCTNAVFSAKINSQTFDFSKADNVGYHIYIKN